MSDFYLTLPSNSSMDYYKGNSLVNFTTRLPNAIDLNGDWEVGLVEIRYPQGRIQDLKLGVAQMDWKILKGWGWGVGGLQIYKKCDYHSIYICICIYIWNTIYFKYAF